MNTHNPNQPSTGESYDGKDNQFQQGAFSRSDTDPKDSMDATNLDDGGAVHNEDNPGDAYTRHHSASGIYNEETEGFSESPQDTGGGKGG